MKKLIAAALCASFSHNLIAGENNYESHAPISVMGDHIHKKGEFMFSYRYSEMYMEGNQNGTKQVSTDEILADFMVAPLEMSMKMHMFGLMYGVTDSLTVMAMLPYKKIKMDLVNRSNVYFSTESEGEGDVSLTSLLKIAETKNSQTLFNFGISLPTGSVTERDDTPVGQNQKLPYPMQIGSGTYDIMPAVVFTETINKTKYGAKASAIIRTGGANDQNYRLGNIYNIASWASYKILPRLALTVNLDAKYWGDVKGRDPELNQGMVPTARPDLRGGKRIDLRYGAEYFISKHSSLAFDAGIPVYESLQGPQMQVDYLFTAGVRVAF